MPLQLTNSLSGKKEVFEPLKAGEVRMYVCGPTVYNFIHIGNARPFVFFDVVERYLKYSGYKVMRVMNFTDVDDKIIQRARDEKTTWDKITEKYIREFQVDMELLKVNPPAVAPKVTDHLTQILSLISGLVEKGAAYVTPEGEVFFAVRKFEGYGKLSGKKIDDLRIGVRVDPNEKKRDPLDFSLWKPQKTADEPAWESPWGKGRPGWHIECSAMSMAHLGETFDLHGGGMDLIHPHHENEIAQSEAKTEKLYAKYWMHNNMLTFHSEKMSKSVGNILLTREFVEKYSAEVLKYMLLSGQYRSTIDFSDKHVKECQTALHRFYTTLKKCENLMGTPAKSTKPNSTEENKLLELGQSFPARWKECMDDDFNTAKLLGLVFDYVRALNGYLDQKGFQPTLQTAPIAKAFITQMQELSQVLNILGEPANVFLTALRQSVLREKGLEAKDIERQIEARKQARKDKDFAKADQIRAELLANGIDLQDRAAGTEWDVVFS